MNKTHMEEENERRKKRRCGNPSKSKRRAENKSSTD